MDYQRAVERPDRGFVIGAMIGGGALLASIAVALIVRAPSEPAPITKVVVMPSAPVVVPVTVTTPVVEQGPEPDPREVRTATPFLQADCLVDAPDAPDALDVDRDTCGWDDGFPAISPDAKTIAMKSPSQDAGENPTLAIQFFDVATGKRLREVRIIDDGEAGHMLYDQQLPLLRRRIAKVHAQLDGYRSMTRVDGIEEQNLEGSIMRADLHDQTFRVIDTSARTSVYQRTFDGTVTDPRCSEAIVFLYVETWWDDATRTLAMGVHYSNGGRSCPGRVITFAKHL